MVRQIKSRKTSRKKMEVVKLRKRKGAKENENIKFKKGGLHESLKFSGTFTKAQMERLDKKKIGQKFTFKGNKFVMTDKLKDQVTLAKTMMSWNKKSRSPKKKSKKSRSPKKKSKKKSRSPKKKSKKSRSPKKKSKKKSRSPKKKSKKKSRSPKKKSKKTNKKSPKKRKPSFFEVVTIEDHYNGKAMTNSDITKYIKNTGKINGDILFVGSTFETRPEYGIVVVDLKLKNKFFYDEDIYNAVAQGYTKQEINEMFPNIDLGAVTKMEQWYDNLE